MALTGVLGTRFSQLGNIQLGKAPVSIFFNTFTDTLTFTDLMVTNYLFSDTITFDDDIEKVYESGDALTFVDAISAHHIAVGVMTDSLSFVDTFVLPLVPDVLTLTDVFSGAVRRFGAMSDSLTFSDTASEHINAVRTTFETLTLTEALTQHMVRVVNISDSVTFSDTMSGLVSYALADTLTFADTMTEVLSKTFKDVLDFDSLFTYNAVFHRGWTDQVTFTDGLLYHATLHPVGTDTLTLVDSFGGVVVSSISDALSLADAISATVSHPLLETLTLGDTFSANKVQFRSYDADVIIFNESLTNHHITFATINDDLTLLDSETGIRIKSAAMNDSVTFTDHAFRTLIEVLTTDILTFSDTLSQHTNFNKHLADVLTFTDTLHENVVFRRSIGDALTLNDGFLVKIIQGDPHPSPPDNVQPIPGGGYQGVITVFPQVVITGVTKSIILPAPEFNDFEAAQGKIAVLRTMMGRFRVYSKRTDREKVNWHFVLPKFKADEFQAFILDEINNDLDITDFKGNKWHAKILSDSVDFTETGRWEPCGNKVEVTIEFEGIKYA